MASQLDPAIEFAQSPAKLVRVLAVEADQVELWRG